MSKYGVFELNKNVKEAIKNNFYDMDEVNISTFSLSDEGVKIIRDKNPNAEINLYISNYFYENNQEYVEKVVQKYNINSLEIIDNHHAKVISGYNNKHNLNITFWGSYNLTKYGLENAYEININQFHSPKMVIKGSGLKKVFDPQNFKYSPPSVLKGLNKILKKQLNEKIIKLKKVKPKHKTKFFDAKNYGKEIVEKSKKIVDKNEENIGIICSPKIDFNFVEQVLEDSLDNINKLFLITNEVKNLGEKENVEIIEPPKNCHAKYFALIGPQHMGVGFGSSNFTPTGLGLNEKYCNNEVNIFFETKTSNFAECLNFMFCPSKEEYFETMINYYRNLYNLNPTNKNILNKITKLLEEEHIYNSLIKSGFQLGHLECSMIKANKGEDIFNKSLIMSSPLMYPMDKINDLNKIFRKSLNI